MIRRFYINGFNEEGIYGAWPRIWSKQFKIRTHDGAFVKLNRFRDRLTFRALKRFCVYYAPLNLYMSVLNWLMPERVGSKGRANRAYPVGGEYVVDVDLHLMWRPHSHYKCRDGVCMGCLSISRDTTLALLDKIAENYSDLHVVFSGKKGFHIHVLDFDLRDWNRYDESARAHYYPPLLPPTRVRAWARFFLEVGLRLLTLAEVGVKPLCRF